MILARVYAPVFGAEIGAIGGYAYAMGNAWLMLSAPVWVLCLFIITCCVVGAIIGSAASPEVR